MNNELAGAVLAADVKAQYDAQCKLVLSQKEVLAWILQGVAEEFALLSREEIKACIEGMPGISSVSVAPGGTGGRITGLETESRIEGEGRVVYDIRFPANLPGHGRLVRLLIDVEAQKDYYPGYQLPTRGIFYGARMISSQLGTEFSGSNYDGLKKVYSIWICMGVPKKIGNAVTEYRMEKRDIRPGFPDRREAYDKLSVIMIGLNGQAGCGEGFIGMLNTLFSTQLDVRQKKAILGMRMDDGLGSEVEQMCNLSGYVEECGIRKGREEGRKEGIREGRKAGIQEGRRTGNREGETRLAKLISLLLQKGDYDGVRLVTEDEAARKRFYREYGIIG